MISARTNFNMVSLKTRCGKVSTARMQSQKIPREWLAKVPFSPSIPLGSLDVFLTVGEMCFKSFKHPDRWSGTTRKAGNLSFDALQVWPIFPALLDGLRFTRKSLRLLLEDVCCRCRKDKCYTPMPFHCFDAVDHMQWWARN